MSASLTICTLVFSEAIAQSLQTFLLGDRFRLLSFTAGNDFLSFLDHEREKADCLILEWAPELSQYLTHLRQQTVLLPSVILTPAVTDPSSHLAASLVGEVAHAYHGAVLALPNDQLPKIESTIDKAIAQFLGLLDDEPGQPAAPTGTDSTEPTSLLAQQRRLSEKLKERLGYLGIYYKRNASNFFRHMTPRQKQELLEQLKHEYRAIILIYFGNDPTLNQRIDNFANLAFFSDISVSQIVEIHMELMDEFSKQLKLEGRSDEILLDYRLTLIDAIAHLCEMYRRSIPRES